MIQNIGFVMMVISITAFVGCIANIIRLRFWSNFIDSEIDNAYRLRVSGNRDAGWPDVNASYDNFKWYQPFNFNFKSMIVYDTTR